ncbi:MAG TPA: glutaredoxin domain-containing protein [Acidobacteriota bacterium]|nr:glutaredoxin domain-containing protein [Acidobacteriota bacterium]
MEYLIFTYPNCPNCESLKKELDQAGLKGKEYSLVNRESKIKIRDYLKVIKRDEKGGIIIPTLLIEEEGKVKKVINTPQELRNWLQSED